MTLKILIVDDEPAARTRLRLLLAEADGVELVGECGDGLSALRVVRERAPDVVFLDLQMPGFDGFATLDALAVERPPRVVFVTALDPVAVRSLDAHGLDYLLKPYDRERFARMLDRVRGEIVRQRSLEAEGVPNGLRPWGKLLDELRREGRLSGALVVRDRGQLATVDPDRIDWVEAAGNYVAIYCGGETHLLRETMKGLETRLDPRRFVRVHRSKLLNVDRIRHLEPTEHGEFVVTLEGGTRFQTGRGFTERLRTRLSRRGPGADAPRA